MSLSARDIIPLLMIVASVWGLFGFVRPHYETIKVLLAEKEQYEDTLVKAEDARHRRGVLLEEYKAISPNDWKRMEKMLPRKADGVQLARDMDALAKVFGIKLSSFSFTEESSDASGGERDVGLPLRPEESFGGEGISPPEDMGTDILIPNAPTLELKKLALSFDFEATYPTMLRFLRELERSLVLADVRSLELSRAGSTADLDDEEVDPVSAERVYDISLSIDTYWVQ